MLRAAETKAVATTQQALAALTDAKRGQSIVLADGDYDLGQLTISVAATEDQPLVIRAQNVGKARFIGATTFDFRRCSYVTLEGFRFESKDDTAVLVSESNHVRITRNHFQLQQPEGATRTHALTSVPKTRAENSRPHWVEISGADSHDNRVDHNSFQDKHTIGVYVAISGDKGPQFQCSQHDRIDHNHFSFIGPRISNGMESIRAGLSEVSLSSGYTIIEQNLFENCDGDPEVISVKQCNGIVRYNTLISCEGGICLRHGNGTEAYGNFFFGNGKRGTVGVRPYGDDSKVYNNYFEGLAGPALQLVNGDFDYGHGEDKDRELLKKHFRPRRLLVGFNTIVNCDLPVEIGTGNAKYFIQDLTFANNLIVGGGTERSIRMGNAPPQPMTFAGNFVSATEGGRVGVDLPQDQLRVTQVPLAKRDGLLRPDPTSQVIDSAAQGKFDLITTDIDGQKRSGKYDVGADEQSSEKIIYHSLTAADVGPESPE